MRKHNLKTLLKRNSSFRPMVKDDMKYLWAAYKKQAFSEEVIPKELNQDDFTDLILSIFDMMNEVFILESITARGKIPVGVVTTKISSRTEPYVDWFPWASKRNKLETVAQFLIKMRKRPMLVWSTEKDVNFFTLLAKYGALRRIGKAIKFSDGKDMMIFQTRGD